MAELPSRRSSFFSLNYRRIIQSGTSADEQTDKTRRIRRTQPERAPTRESAHPPAGESGGRSDGVVQQRPHVQAPPAGDPQHLRPLHPRQVPAPPATLRAPLRPRRRRSVRPAGPGGGRSPEGVRVRDRGPAGPHRRDFQQLRAPLRPRHPLARPRLPRQEAGALLNKKVFPNFYVLGWYSTGSDAEESDMHIHKALMDINESPVYVLLNPSINHAQKDLPVTIYESELHVIDGIPQLIFVRASYTIETVEAERISVDHVAHLKPSDGGTAATQLAAHLTGIHSAIKMLNSRVRVLHHYLLAMQKGEIPCENSLLRQVSSLLRRLPAIESGKFQDDFLMEYNDTLLITYLAMLTNCSSTMNELIDKFNTAYDRHSRRGGRTPFV
ncbi:hypothetical protein EUGRSUZ_F03640 [Eucalyptus grandis]|uniref:Uncharacterized protein n=2 Tax=Eucalyptus grandis TaxID=71139 RepID=A0ACC3KM11_EUCGR|nr:hypothetical protein EUGRSUZ_F03640 [Eucalyptus grandis]